MPRRRRIRRKPPVEEYEEVEDIEEEDLDDEDLEESEDIEEEDLDDDDEDYDDEDDEDYEEEDEDEPPPKPAPKKVKPPVKKAAPAKPQPKAEKVEIEVKKVDTVVAEEVLTGLLEAMDDGQSLIVTKLAGNKWQFSSGKAAVAAVAASQKLVGKEYWNEVATPEYLEWQEEWSTLTYAEKKKKAKALKATWEPHKDERIDLIRIAAAVQEALGIEKYKPDYSTRSARSRLQGK